MVSARSGGTQLITIPLGTTSANVAAASADTITSPTMFSDCASRISISICAEEGTLEPITSMPYFSVKAAADVLIFPVLAYAVIGSSPLAASMRASRSNSSATPCAASPNRARKPKQKFVSLNIS